jgi:hypothetical protein
MYVCFYVLQEKEEEAVKKVPASEHPLYAKFFKMLKVAILTYIHTPYIHTYIHTYIFTYTIHTYITCVPLPGGHSSPRSEGEVAVGRSRSFHPRYHYIHT